MTKKYLGRNSEPRPKKHRQKRKYSAKNNPERTSYQRPPLFPKHPDCYQFKNLMDQYYRVQRQKTLESKF